MYVTFYAPEWVNSILISYNKNSLMFQNKNKQANKALADGEFLSNFHGGGGAGSAIRPSHEDIATR